MVKKYECEIRILIPNIDTFKERLLNLGAKKEFWYEFTDHYFKPEAAKPWDVMLKSIRIREWKSRKRECEVLFTKIKVIDENGVSFKKSVYSEGKIKLFSGSFDLCKKFLADLGFEPWFSVIKKNCEFFVLPEHEFKIAVEYVEGLGWSGEIEADGSDIKRAREKLAQCLDVLGVKGSDITPKPLAKIFADAIGKR
jgi:predicted adenylyl cyclase CyaB